MLLRLRLPDGLVVRQAVPEPTSSTLADILTAAGAKVPADGGDVTLLDRDRRKLDVHRTVADLQLGHGDLIALPRASTRDSAPTPSSSVSAGSDSGAMTKTLPPALAQAAKRCKFHGPGMVCSSCVPAESAGDRLDKALRELWTANARSSAVEAALAAMVPTLKAQPTGAVASVGVDTDAAREFQAYVHRIDMQQQRVALLFGSFEPAGADTAVIGGANGSAATNGGNDSGGDARFSSEVHVSAIYEPPQRGDSHAYRLRGPDAAGGLALRTEDVLGPTDNGENDSEELGAAELNARALSLARALGLEWIGVALSHRPRDAALSAYDVVSCASLQSQQRRLWREQQLPATSSATMSDDDAANDAAATSGAAAAPPPFVVLTVSRNEDDDAGGGFIFNAFELSEQCVELSEGGVFAAGALQRRNGSKLKLNPEGWVVHRHGAKEFRLHEVIVEGAARRDAVPAEFFLINARIRSEAGWLRTVGPVENRDRAPQTTTAVASALTDTSEKRFVRRISDFHLLYFFCSLMDLLTEMPGLFDILREQRDPTEDESGYELLLWSLASQ